MSIEYRFICTILNSDLDLRLDCVGLYLVVIESLEFGRYQAFELILNNARSHCMIT